MQNMKFKCALALFVGDAKKKLNHSKVYNVHNV